MSGFSNFAVSFTIISILSGCLTAYGIAMTNGGPVDMTWGWILVGLMTLVVGLGMAEVCSAYPTAGGLYYWSAKLAKRNGAAWSWFTGWFNLLGQVAVTAGIDYGFSLFFNAFLNLTTGWAATPGHTLIIYAGILIVHAALNIFGRPGGGLPLRRERVVAHPRRPAYRDRPARRPGPSRLDLVRVHQARQRDRVPQQLLRLHDRPAPGPVHLHRATTPRPT